MYNSNTIKESLFGLIGWRQNYDTTTYSLANSLTESRSYQYFQEFHPLLTVDNIGAIAPDLSRVTYSEWTAGTPYAEGALVELSSVKYRATVDSTGQSPDTAADYWEETNAISEWLRDKTKGSILKAIRTMWDQKMSEKRAKNLLEQRAIFDGTGRLADTITSTGNLVGFEITPIRAKGITTKLNKIGLQFTGTGEMTVYLFHSSRTTPIKSQVITRTRAGGMEWFNLTDWEMPYVSSEIDSGGSWYLCYSQDATNDQVAVNKSKDWSKAPCSTCSRVEYSAWQVWSKHIEFHPFRVSDFTVGEMWDVQDNIYTSTENYGINLQISIECDATELITEQETAFQNLIGLQVANDFLRELVYNPSANLNRTQQNTQARANQILYELDGDSQGKKSGLKFELEKAMKAVKFDIREMSKVCFPCRNNGIRFR